MLSRTPTSKVRRRRWLQSSVLGTLMATSFMLAPVEAPVSVAGVPVIGAEAACAASSTSAMLECNWISLIYHCTLCGIAWIQNPKGDLSPSEWASCARCAAESINCITSTGEEEDEPPDDSGCWEKVGGEWVDTCI